MKKPQKYDPAAIELKWQKKWAKSKIYKSREAKGKDGKKRKYYVLDMFPYPSGEGLHVGHPKGYIATDVISRYRRMKGYSVLHPMGFDAFGLPAENYALKTKTNPEIAVKKNVARYKKQLEILGLDYDWSREVNTTDPNYYRWTQWIFLQLYKKGLAYESFEPINWCPSCKTGLANEDVENGRCERCGTPVEKKPLRQWVLRITDYAERLLTDLDATDYVMPKLVDKTNPHQPGKPLVKRHVAHAMVYDPRNKKYLIIRNKKFGWDTVIIGGIEGDESPVDTARREVREETGYSDLEFKRILGGPTEAHYFTKHKGENRIAIAQAVYFELKSDARVPIADGEDKDNEILWVDENEFVPGKMVNSELPVWLSRLNAEVTIDPKSGIAHFKDISPISAVRPDMPFVERNAIAAVVKHWKEDKYMALQWKKVSWRTLITGGPDGDESLADSALREVIEETGFLHPKFIRKLGNVDATFYHNPKGVNRVGHFNVFYFELKDGERRELTAEEAANHEVAWLTKEDMETFLTPSGQKYIWHTLFLGKKDSHFMSAKPLLDWPNSIKELQKNWIGKSEGAEIDFPIAQKRTYVLLHGYKGYPTDPIYPWLKKELESRGHPVIIPALPDSTHLTENAQVAAALAAARYDENTIIYGHSLGTVVAMKVVEKLSGKVGGLVLAGGFPYPNFKDHPRPFSNTFRWEFDGKKIKEKCGFISLVHDTSDPFISTQQAERLSELLETPLTLVKAQEPHFDAPQEPAILSALLRSATVFTTRPDTLFGVTYLVLAPEHRLVKELLPSVSNRADVEAYILRTQNETEIARTDAKKDKTGVELKGVKVINPANGEQVPVWIADYVLGDYGTGAVMAVPAHDERDFEFAKKFKLPIKQVIAPETGIKRENEQWRTGGCAIIFDPKTQKYAVGKKDTGYYIFFGGGVDEKEDLKEGVLREVREESGLYDFDIVEKIDVAFPHFFNSLKKINRIAKATCFLIVLKSNATQDAKREAHEDFNLAWFSAEEIEANFHKWNTEKDVDHWLWFLKDAVGRAKELGYDKTSPEKYKQGAYTGSGLLVDSREFSNKNSESVKKEITTFAGGRWVNTYKLRDWVFSRQRYWGEPIPLIHCPKCGVVPVPEKDLPVKLPKVKSYEPTGTGESPLAAISKWVNVKCPSCKGPAKRETNTMPQWAGSSWYYLRFEDPKNKKAFVDPKKEKYWSPVDLYVGGAEHATRHLIYARFWHKVLYDLGHVSTSEPFTKLQSVGLIMGEDGRKMSKRFGNVINPDEIVKTFGADTLRIYEMFMGPFDQQISWNTNSMVGSRRFIERVWKMREKTLSTKSEILNKSEARSPKAQNGADKILHKTIKKVSEDIESMRFNTAISSLMIAVNELEKADSVSKDQFESLLKLIAPFAPHAADDLWSQLGNKKSIHISSWPAFDPALAASDEATIAVQVNGKARGMFSAPRDSSEETLRKTALALPEIKKWIEGKTVQKVIVVRGRVVSIIVS